MLYSTAAEKSFSNSWNVSKTKKLYTEWSITSHNVQINKYIILPPPIFFLFFGFNETYYKIVPNWPKFDIEDEYEFVPLFKQRPSVNFL